MRPLLLALSASALVVVAGCGTGAAPASPTAASPASVDYQGFKANPATLEVTKGTRVTWTNKDTTAHTVTTGTNRQKDGKVDSGNMSPNTSFDFTFNDVGAFEYFCSIHNSMVGFKVVVK